MQTSSQNQTPLSVAVFRACTPNRAKDYHHAIAASPYKYTEIIDWQDDFTDPKTWSLAKIRNRQLMLAKQIQAAWTLILDCDVILENFRPQDLPCEAVSRCWSPNYHTGNVNTSWWAIPRQILHTVPDFDENFVGMFFEDIDWMKRLETVYNANQNNFVGVHIHHPLVTGKEEIFEINRAYYNRKHGESL